MEQPFEHHVKELRNRLKIVTAAFVLYTGISFYYAPNIIEWIQSDLTIELYALRAPEVLFVQITAALLIGFFATLPFLLYQLLKFAEPGLKRQEYLAIRNYLPLSLVLFVIGAAFGYEVIVKSSLRFFSSVTEASNAASVWGMKSTLGFALKLSAFTGVMYQLPVVSAALARAGLVDSEMMVKYRAYFIVGVLLLAAFATPPDVVTQVLLTAPVILLYQLSIWLVSRIEG